jgi:hypothetical protein
MNAVVLNQESIAESLIEIDEFLAVGFPPSIIADRNVYRYLSDLHRGMHVG